MTDSCSVAAAFVCGKRSAEKEEVAVLFFFPDEKRRLK